LATLEKGLVKFPQEFYFLGNLINHYVFGGQPQKATELLDKAIANDPTNAQLYSVRGSMLEVLEDMDAAMANFDKAIELKPDFKEAWLGKARVIYNKAFKMEQKALEIKDYKLSDIAVAKAFEVYKESIPFFEKVIELDPEDFETMKTLRSLFYKLTNSDPSYQAKYDEINKKMLGY
jgi:tetratricopeptide (TPR) repeat protein